MPSYTLRTKAANWNHIWFFGFTSQENPFWFLIELFVKVLTNISEGSTLTPIKRVIPRTICVVFNPKLSFYSWRPRQRFTVGLLWNKWMKGWFCPERKRVEGSWRAGWRGAIGDGWRLVVRRNGGGGDSWVGVVSSEALAVQSPPLFP